MQDACAMLPPPSPIIGTAACIWSHRNRYVQHWIWRSCRADGRTALYWAAEQKNEYAVKQLCEPFHPQNRVGRGWGIRNGAMGAVRLPKILVLTLDAYVSA